MPDSKYVLGSCGLPESGLFKAIILLAATTQLSVTEFLHVTVVGTNAITLPMDKSTQYNKAKN